MEANYFTILCWFCHASTWICLGCTRVPHPEPHSHFLPYIPLGCPRAPALGALLHASNLCWSSISYMVIYMVQCYSLISSHSHLLPHRPKVCSLYLCLFCCLAYRVTVTIFLNSIYMHSVQFSSVAQLCPTLCNSMNRSTPGLSVHHQLPEFIQTHVHRVSDAIQPFHPLSSPSPPAPNPSQHQSLFQWVSSSHEVAKVLERQL